MAKGRARLKLMRNGKPIGWLTMIGKSAKKAEAAGKRLLSNIAAGYYDDKGFHPIRSSPDYSPARAGEGRVRKGAARYTKRRRKAARRRTPRRKRR